MGKQKITPKFPKELIQYVVFIFLLMVATIYAIFFIRFNLLDILKLVLFIGIGAASRLPQRMSPISFGIELVTLVTISSAILYGGLIGAFVGVSCFLLSGFYTREKPQDVLVAIIGMASVGYFSPLAYSTFSSIGLTALVLTFVYDLFTNIAYVLLGSSPFSCLRFSVVHIPSNYLILKYLGPKLIGL